MLRKKPKQTNKTKQKKIKQIIATAFLSLRKTVRLLTHAEQNHFQGHGAGFEQS